jgi:hypothetical protein
MRRSVYLALVMLTALRVANADIIVSGNVSGSFGSPSDQTNPLILAGTVGGPAIIQIATTGCPD